MAEHRQEFQQELDAIEARVIEMFGMLAEDLMQEIKSRYTIVIVTHNMQQATRVSDRTAFYSVLRDEKSDTRTGVLVEYGYTQQIFGDPQDDRTKAYVTGRMG